MSQKLLFPQGFPQRGEIYLVDFNRKKGQEIRKIRPALVISNDIQNEFDTFLIVVPLSSDRIDKIRAFEILIAANQVNGLEKNSKTLLNQVHSVDKWVRCQKYLGKINEDLLKEINQKLKLVLALE